MVGGLSSVHNRIVPDLSPIANTNSQSSTEISPKDQNTGEQWFSRSSFSRTIWLPRAVDASKITAKLEDGILKLVVPKVESQKEKHKITVD